jgi:hypothetical protein
VNSQQRAASIEVSCVGGSISPRAIKNIVHETPTNDGWRFFVDLTVLVSGLFPEPFSDERVPNFNFPRLHWWWEHFSPFISRFGWIALFSQMLYPLPCSYSKRQASRAPSYDGPNGCGN